MRLILGQMRGYVSGSYKLGPSALSAWSHTLLGVLAGIGLIAIMADYRGK